MRVRRADGTFIEVGELNDQIYTWDAPDGLQWHWSVVAATAFAQARNEIVTISLAEMDVDGPMLRQVYPDLDAVYALTTDLTRPLVFVPVGEEVRLIDGSHRVCKALLLGIDLLPAYFLTEEESEASLIARLPAIPGLTGQRVPRQEPPQPGRERRTARRRR